jgi:cation:H+ antiporter
MGRRTWRSVWGCPELVVGLSVVAVGTSLPELATTVLAACPEGGGPGGGEHRGLQHLQPHLRPGGTALIHPLDIPGRVLRVELPATLALSVLLLPLAWSRFNLSRKEGVMLLGAYAGAWVWILMGS